MRREEPVRFEELVLPSHVCFNVDRLRRNSKIPEVVDYFFSARRSVFLSGLGAKMAFKIIGVVTDGDGLYHLFAKLPPFLVHRLFVCVQPPNPACDQAKEYDDEYEPVSTGSVSCAAV